MKKENRGGARPGAGRPRKEAKEFSDEFKTGLLAAMEKMSEETGKTPYDIAIELLYGKIRCQDTTRVSVFKIIAEVMTVKESEKTITEKKSRPVVMLPAIGKPDEMAIKEMNEAENN